jgi:molecular chaperone DnaK
MNADLDQVVLVYDLGGGTFDASLIEMRGGIFEVRASHGDTQLGGDDFDVLLAQTIRERFESTHGVSVRDPRALARLNRAAEGTKIALSNHPYVLAREEYLMEKRGVPLHLEQEISRKELETLVDDLLQKTLTAVDQTLEDARLAPSDLDVVLLVGGSTFIPRVRELLGNHLGIEPRSVVNPREVVALGAAVQGAIVAGQPVDAILVDVTPHSLGIEIATIQMGRIIPGIYKVLIPRNTAVPTSQEEEFYPLFPDQNTVQIKVYQGEHPVAEQNTLLGEFLVQDLKPKRSEELPQVDVQFSLDVDGVLHINATDRRTGKKKGITVTASPTRMDASEITRAQAELQLWDEEAGPLLARARLLLQEDLDENDHQELQQAISELEQALQSGDPGALEACKDELLFVLYELEE